MEQLGITRTSFLPSLTGVRSALTIRAALLAPFDPMRCYATRHRSFRPCPSPPLGNETALTAPVPSGPFFFQRP